MQKRSQEEMVLPRNRASCHTLDERRDGDCRNDAPFTTMEALWPGNRPGFAIPGESVVSIPRVWSCNEWDPLEEVIVGNPLKARYPTPDLSTQLAEFPDRSLADIPRGPFPQRIIEETDEDLNEFQHFLE